jgi:membrane-associated protein
MQHLADGLFDVAGLIHSAGSLALLLVCAIVFVETGLLIGFLLPGDTLLLITGILTFQGTIAQPIWVVCGAIFLAAVLGDQLGYLIGRKGGPAVFERKSSGFFSRKSVERTNGFFARYGGLAVTIARFVPVARTIAPVAAGIGRMSYRKFLLYNVLGALVWGVGLTMVGWGVAHIPGVAELVTKYIEVVLLGVVGVVVLSILVHWLKERRELKREQAEAAAGSTDSGPVLTTLDSTELDER